MNSTNGVPYIANLIQEGFWSIEEGGVRAFLVEGTQSAMLVDSGYGTGDIKAFAESLTKLPIFLLNTHTDQDHVGCNNSFTKVKMHPAEVQYYKMKKPDHTIEIETVQEGEIIDLGNRQFEIIHIPGHTPGSIALLDRKNRLLISGDSVSLSGIFMFGIGRDIKTYIQSMDKLEGILDGSEVIYPSHGEMPVAPDIIPELAEGARKVMNGEVEGQKPPFDLQCLLYATGRAKFLYKET